MTAEDRELLAHAIWTTGRTRAVDRFPLADALMPVVEAIARRRVAEELRAAAAEIEQARDECPNKVRRQGYGGALYLLKRRAHADELTHYEEMPLACWEKQLVTEPFEQFTCALPTGHDGPCVR